MPSDPHQPLREDVRLLGELLGHVLRQHEGEDMFDRVERVIRVTGYVNADPDFTDCHLVINGATNLLKAVFGPDAGRHARTALGMGQLPLGTSVEVEAIFQLRT